MSSTFKNHYTYVILDSGVQGLAAGRTFLRLTQRLSPSNLNEKTLLILESRSSVGGVWSKEKIYSTLHTNNVADSYSLPSFPMLSAGLEHLGVRNGARVPGAAMHEYMERFAEWAGLNPYVRLNNQCVAAEEIDLDLSLALSTTEHDSPNKTRLPRKGWRLTVRPIPSRKSWFLTCNILLDCSGVYSSPLPLPQPLSHHTFQSRFGRPILPFNAMPTVGGELASDPKVTHVAVLGTAKSAYDAVYFFTTTGKKVTWVVRKSRPGSTYMVPSYARLGPVLKWTESLLTTRPLVWFGPCIWGAMDGFEGAKKLLHGTVVGKWIVKQSWTIETAISLWQTGYTNASKGKGIKGKGKLVPRHSMFCYATQTGIMNYDQDFWEARGKA